MLTLELLEELVAFQKYGTLSSAAEHLMVTQPTITRGMKKIEEQLGVQLFDRSIRNRIRLNETGILAATEAAKLLQSYQNFENKVRNHALQKNKIIVSSVLPGPLMLLELLEAQLNCDFQFETNLITAGEVISLLDDFSTHLIFTDQEIETSDIESMYLGVEKLSVALDNFNPLAQHSSVNFKQLANLTFLADKNIGPWRDILESNIPDATFLYQEKFEAVNKLSQYSNFPFFFSKLSCNSEVMLDRFSTNSRTLVKIDDPNNSVEIFGTYHKSKRKLIQPILKKLIQNWPNN